MGHSTSTHLTPLGSLGLGATHTDELIHRVEAGLPYHALQTLAEVSGIPVVDIAAIIGIPGRTLARRRIAGKFEMFESERLLRISTLFEKAVELFEGNVSAAVSWLSTPKRALRNHTPWDYVRTELGAREVENLIGRLEHGVFT